MPVWDMFSILLEIVVPAYKKMEKDLILVTIVPLAFFLSTCIINVNWSQSHI